jgi:hypothetical protein
VTFTRTAPFKNSVYVYESAAKLSDIAGARATTDLQGTPVSLNITATGSFAATAATGCAFSGSFTPRASGKNVFDVAIKFGAAPCGLPSQTASAIGTSFPLSSGRRQLLVAGADDATSNNGAALIGAR